MTDLIAKISNNVSFIFNSFYDILKHVLKSSDSFENEFRCCLFQLYTSGQIFFLAPGGL